MKTTLALFIAALLLFAAPDLAFAIDYIDNPPPLLERLTPDVLEAVFPGASAERLEEVDGPPSAVAVHNEDGSIAGYVFSTLDIVRARGFVWTPFDVLAGITADGRVTGTVEVFNRESYIYGNARRTELLANYLASFAGLAYNRLIESPRRPDYVAGASISARAMRSAVADSARMVMRSLYGAPVVTVPTIDRESFTTMTREELAAQGSIRTITLTNGDVAAALSAAGIPADAALDTALHEDLDEVYITFSVGLATPPMISRNLIYAEANVDKLTLNYPEGTNGVLLGSDGRYNFQGIKFLNESTGRVFDRVEVVQNGTTHSFHADDYYRAPGQLGPYSGVLVFPPDTGFDPLQPFTVNLLVHATLPGGEIRTIAFPVEYEVPTAHILLPEPEPEPAWVETWRESRMDIIILAAALIILTLIFAFQARLARHRRLHRVVRNAFLVFTVVWLGYVAGGQLSIIHITNFLHAPFENIDIGFYLTEPLIIIVAVYSAIALILIGRGVFCGWLCPFGALQEFAYKAGRLLRLPVWNPTHRMQRWLWLPKYGIAGLIIVTAFAAPEVSAATTEVEPFKTAITSAFSRPWPFVLYALLLLSLGLFSERAYCRFLCPLGGVLAALDRLHILNLLKRRPECGSTCHLCERSCPVKAIAPSGRIVTAECFQCLDCQVEYYDDRRCPPLAQARKRLRRAIDGGVVLPGAEPVLARV